LCGKDSLAADKILAVQFRVEERSKSLCEIIARGKVITILIFFKEEI
jgi:hypothetical protein